MNLTNEQIQAILDGAPEGATHVNYFKIEPTYLKMDGIRWNQYIGEEWLDAEEEELRHYLDFRNLGDLNEIITLRQEVGRLKDQQSEVAARVVEDLKCEVHRAIGNMEYAAFNLCESMNLDSESGGRTVETSCPEKSLLIAIRDLKEATGAR